MTLAIHAAGSWADRVEGGVHPLSRAEEELGYVGDEIGQLSEAPLIEEKHESSMRLLSPPAASSASQVLLAAGRAFAGVSCTCEC